MTHSNTTVPEVNGFGQTVNFDPVAPNLWFVNNTFDQDTFLWMKGLMYDTNTVYNVTRPEGRLILADCDATRHIQEIGAGLIPQLNKITGQNLNLMVAKYWLDLPHFGCQPHSDSKEIIVTLQIYIDVVYNDIWPSNLQIHGAEFMHIDPPVETPLTVNGGYLNLNTDLKQHQVLGGMGSRCSIAFQYNLSTDS
jgi:hypothetical protein